MFVIGTSLVVYPFAGLPEYTHPKIPRVVLNKDVVENFERPNDIYIPGDCDESVWSLCQKLGWEKDLLELHNEIGGVVGDWMHKEGVENSPAGTESTRVEDSVEQLRRELEQELKLDKEEDIELRKAEDIVDKSDDAGLKSDTWDDDSVVVTKKDSETKEETGKDPKEEDPSKDPKEKQ